MVAQTPATVFFQVIWVTGLSMIALALLLRFVNLDGEPLAWSVQEASLRTAMSFLNLT